MVRREMRASRARSSIVIFRYPKRPKRWSAASRIASRVDVWASAVGMMAVYTVAQNQFLCATAIVTVWGGVGYGAAPESSEAGPRQIWADQARRGHGRA